MMQAFKDWVLLLFGFDWLNVLLALFGLFTFSLLVFWQMRRRDGFDLRMLAADSVIDEKTGDITWTVRPGKIFQTGAFLLTSWLMIYVTTHDKLTEAYLFLYAALWAASPVMNRWAISKYPIAGEQPPPTTPPAP